MSTPGAVPAAPGLFPMYRNLNIGIRRCECQQRRRARFPGVPRRPPPPVILRCRFCDERVQRSTRRAAALRQAGQQPVCDTCRASPSKVVVTDELRDYWRARLDVGQIVELGGALDR